MNRTVEFKLEKPLIIGKDGENTEELVITLRAPSLTSEKAKKNCIKLKALALAAMGKTQKFWGDTETDEDTAKEKEDTGENMLTGFATAGVDILPLIDIMEELAPMVMLAGEDTNTTSKNWKFDLTPDDQMKVTGVFIKNFTLASILSKS